MNTLASPPSISVVIPTYNGEAWVAETLESVFQQTLPPLEVIVVDDASTDSTADRVAAIAKNAPVEVKLVRLESNSGSPAPTLNKGIARAHGEFIAVLDQDDVFLPSKLELQARALSGDPGMSFVFSLFCRYDNGMSLRNQATARLRVRRLQRRMTLADDIFRCDGIIALEEIARTSTNFFGGYPGFMFRRSAWALKGGLDESLIVASDFDILCWLCTQGTVGLIPLIHYRRRDHSSSITKSTGIRWRLDAIDVLLRYADLVDTAKTIRIIKNSIHHHLWEVARRLASGGHRAAARDVAATVSEMVQARWQIPVQRLAIPAYVGYYKLIGRPWKISEEQASEAVELAGTATQRLAKR